jgi:CHAT domain-containing protein/Tfp pilus assembly protein PilF
MLQLHRPMGRLLGVVVALTLVTGGAAIAKEDDEAEVRAAFEKGKALHDKGNYQDAAVRYEKALALAPRVLGADHINMAVIQNNLANLYNDMGQYGKAEPLYRRSLEIKEARLGKDHPAVAVSLHNLANVYKHMGHYGKAEPLYRRSLDIREARLGKDHPDVAQSLNNLATLYAHMGKYAKAEPLYRRSLEIKQTLLGKDHPDVARSLNNLAILHAAQEEWDEVALESEAMRRVVRRFVTAILPILSEKEQLTFLHTHDETPFQVALSIGLLRRTDGAMASRSAAWLLNGKAVAREALTERAVLERDASDPTCRELVQELVTVRRQRATLALASPKPGQESERFRQLEELTVRQQELERRLHQAGGHTRPADRWIELAEVRAALPADAVLIDIARFRVANFKALGTPTQWPPAHYAAWVIPAAGQGDVHLIDLGPADDIDAAVQEVRKSLLAAQGTRDRPSSIQQLGEPDAEKELRRPLEALARLVLEPLDEHIGAKKRWLVSPDAALWLVPWAALPLKDGGYAVEKHTISYLVSGRDLVRPSPQGKVGRPRILADPDYDLGLDVARAETLEIVARTFQPLEELRGLSDSFRLGRVQRLPGTADEAVAITPSLERYAGEAPAVYQREQELEGVCKAIRRPRVLVLSTHGFFMPDQEAAVAERPGLEEKRAALDREGKPLENPLLRCGLLLAGCNNRSEAKDGDEDGVLTGLEIVGMDLRGTELVVLSACETGLGQVRNGEGVAGLRQAFQLAGARAVVATLWQISDKASARLTSAFFANLADGQGKAEALRNAQLERIAAHRKRSGAAHPFFWAAFTLTGEAK